MNHKVHLCISGCFTLKLSGSWKTVICSSLLAAGFSSLSSSPSRETGMVDRSTGAVGSAAAVGASTVGAAMFVVGEGV